MGEVVGRLADVAVVTSDNPRSEDPGAVIAEVLAGISGTAEVVVEPDRFAAVGRAVAAAGPGDGGRLRLNFPIQVLIRSM